MLKLTNVSKTYGKQLVLDQISLDFDNPTGVYGILGRNGVGKTTLMKIILYLCAKNKKRNCRNSSALIVVFIF